MAAENPGCPRPVYAPSVGNPFPANSWPFVPRQPACKCPGQTSGSRLDPSCCARKKIKLGAIAAARFPGRALRGIACLLNLPQQRWDDSRFQFCRREFWREFEEETILPNEGCGIRRLPFRQALAAPRLLHSDKKPRRDEAPAKRHGGLA